MERRDFLKMGTTFGLGALLAPALLVSCRKEENELELFKSVTPAAGGIELNLMLKKISIFTSDPLLSMTDANLYDGVPTYNIQFDFYEENGLPVKPQLRIAGRTNTFVELSGIQDQNQLGRGVDTFCRFTSLQPIDQANSQFMHASGFFTNAGNPQIAFRDNVTGGAIEQVVRVNFQTPPSGAQVTCYLNDGFVTQNTGVLGLDPLNYPPVQSLFDANQIIVDALTHSGRPDNAERVTAFQLNFLDCGSNPNFILGSDFANGLSFNYVPNGELQQYLCLELRRN